MKTKIFLSILFISILVSCKSDIDNEKPIIDINFENAFPSNCEILKKGKSYQLVMQFTDNVELGSYSIEIHHNFDQHTHSTEITECTLSAKKEAINPFILIKNYEIPSGKKNFLTNDIIQIPDDIDIGDYHLVVRLTDKEGWSDFKGLSIKII